MRGRQRGIKSSKGGGLAGTQNGGSPLTPVQSVISLGGQGGAAGLLTEGAPAPPATPLRVCVPIY